MLGYDALRRLISWQNTATSPTQTASYAYDGSGNRVQQSVTSGGTTTTTSYIGSFEEVSVIGDTTTITKYYSAGVASVVNVNGTLTYLVADALSSVSVALTAAGGVQATNLYSPYGSVRYTNGTMPTSYGYTKMRQDPSGLNYDNARYYDTSVGQFVSADAKQGPNRYGYVAGNPETFTDPTGNNICSDDRDLCKPKRPAPGGGSTQNPIPAPPQTPTPPPGCSSYGAVQLPGCPTTPTPTPTKTAPSSPSSSDCPTGHIGVCFSGSGNGLISKFGGGGHGFDSISGRGLEGLMDLETILNQILSSVNADYNDMMGLLTAGGIAAIFTTVFGFSTAVVDSLLAATGSALALTEGTAYYGFLHKERELVDGVINSELSLVDSHIHYDQTHNSQDNTLYTITESNISYGRGVEEFSYAIDGSFLGWGAIFFHPILPGFQRYGQTWTFSTSD